MLGTCYFRGRIDDFAVCLGNEKVVGLLLQKGANVNAVNILLNTPLHISAQNGKKIK